MRKAEPEITRTIYPRLPDIPDLETLELVTTVEEDKFEYISQFETDRRRFFVLLYIKAMSYLGHSEGTVAIEGAKKYAPMTQHLLPRDQFLRNIEKHLKKLGLPRTAAEHYGSLKKQCSDDLLVFDTEYGNLKKQFRVNKNGTLGFSKTPKDSTPPHIEKLSTLLSSYIPSVTILDVLLDIHRLTGFLDAFQPVGGRQNMDEQERILYLITTLYAYGCNCGPTQSSQATGTRKQRIHYMKRHYMDIRMSAEAVATLVDGYSRTRMSHLLRDPGLFMTDGMAVDTLVDSLMARHHYRYGGGRRLVLYQHVLSDCICFFTQGLLCDVFEGLYMVKGLEQAIAKAREDGIEIAEEDLKHILPTMVEHINFVGHFHLDWSRKPPFEIAA